MTRSIIGLGAAALLLSAPALAGSPPAIEWQRTFGSTDTNVFAAVAASSGGYLLAGLVNQSLTNTDIYLRRTDSAGNTLWHRSYGGPDHDGALDVVRTSAGGYAVAGFWTDSAFAYVLATDSAGDSLWAHRGPWMAAADNIARTSDGGFISAGLWWDDTVHLIRLDQHGTAAWTKSVPTGHSANWFPRTAPVKQTTDGGFITAAEALVKTDSLGNVQWTRGYDGVSVIYSVIQTSDGGYIATGMGSDPVNPAHTQSMILLKTNGQGVKQWKRVFRGGRSTAGRYVLHASGGGYLVVGNSGGPYIIRTDSQGNALWSTTLDTVGFMDADQALPTPDGGWLIVAGYHYLKLGAENP